MFVNVYSRNHNVVFPSMHILTLCGTCDIVGCTRQSLSLAHFLATPPPPPPKTRLEELVGGFITDSISNPHVLR